MLNTTISVGAVFPRPGPRLRRRGGEKPPLQYRLHLFLKDRKAELQTLFRRLARVFVYLAALHYEDDASQGGDVMRRVAVDGDQIGFESWRERADAVFHVDRFRRQGSRRDDRIHRLLAAFADTRDQLIGVTAVRARDGVGSHHE